MEHNVNNTIIKQKDILLKTQNYVRRYFNSSVKELDGARRIIITYTLFQFNFTPSDVAGFLGVSPRTVYRERESAEILFKSSHLFRERCNKLKEYINYFKNYMAR